MPPTKKAEPIVETVKVVEQPKVVTPLDLNAPNPLDRMFGVMADTGVHITKLAPMAAVSLIYQRGTFKLIADWQIGDHRHRLVSRVITPETPIDGIIRLAEDFQRNVAEQAK